MVLAASEMILQRMAEEEAELERTKEARAAAAKAHAEKQAKRDALDKAHREKLAAASDPKERLFAAIELGDADGVYLIIKKTEREETEDSGSLLDRTGVSVAAIVDATTPDGATPLYAACKKGFAECADHLLRNGATPQRATHAGGFTPLWIACAKGHPECVKLMLMQRGVVASINQRAVDGRTPLYAACEGGNAKCVELLIDAGADVEACRNDMSTPLIVAAVFGHHEVVHKLIEHGALLKPRDEDGTALENARRQLRQPSGPHARCVELLEVAMRERGVLELDAEYGGAPQSL